MYRRGYLDYDEEDRLMQGTVYLSAGPVAGSVNITGEGKLQGKMKSSRFQTSADCKGKSEVSGSAYGNYLHIVGSPVSGSCHFTERGKTTEMSAKDSDTSFRCEFQNVDTVNGGRYEVQANGEESQWATCQLELKPQQR